MASPTPQTPLTPLTPDPPLLARVSPVAAPQPNPTHTHSHPWCCLPCRTSCRPCCTPPSWRPSPSLCGCHGRRRWAAERATRRAPRRAARRCGEPHRQPLLCWLGALPCVAVNLRCAAPCIQRREPSKRFQGWGRGRDPGSMSSAAVSLITQCAGCCLPSRRPAGPLGPSCNLPPLSFCCTAGGEGCAAQRGGPGGLAAGGAAAAVHRKAAQAGGWRACLPFAGLEAHLPATKLATQRHAPSRDRCCWLPSPALPCAALRPGSRRPGTACMRVPGSCPYIPVPALQVSSSSQATCPSTLPHKDPLSIVQIPY